MKTKKGWKRRILYIVVVVIVSVILFFPVFSMVSRMGIPTERHYPNYIKGVWEPWPPVDLAQDMERVRQDNINLVSLGPLVIEPGMEFFYEPTIYNAVKQAKINGFAVHIAPQAFGSEGADPSKVSDKDLEEYTEKILFWAKESERMGIEYFSPMNEPDCVLGPDRAVEWHKKVLPEIRKVYSGKVLAKWGCGECMAAGCDYEGDYYRTALLQRIEASGDFDGVMLDMFPPEKPDEFEGFLGWLESAVVNFSEEAERQKIPIYIGEFAIATEKPELAEKIMPGPVVSEEEQAQFTAAYLDIVMPRFDGVVYCGWALPGYGMKDKTVESVIAGKFSGDWR